VKTFNNWLTEQELRQILTYDIYYKSLDNLSVIDEKWINENIITDKIKNIKNLLTGGLNKIFNEIKMFTEKISKELNIGISEVIKAFKDRNVFNILKSFGFAFKKILKCVNIFTTLIKQGILGIFDEIVKTKTFQKIKSGAIKVDELLNRYPLLKRLTGIAMAGLLLWMWLNMTFIGDLDYDFNFGDIINAISGNFSIEQLFFSSSGLMLITLFGVGNFMGISFPWLGKSVFNLMMGISYTGFVKLRDSNLANKIKKKLDLRRAK
jgi:hypothetical protein